MGLMVAMPVGPMALYSVETGATRGTGQAWWAAAGAALADMLWALGAAVGMSWLGEVLHRWQGPLRGLSGFLLLAWGLWGLWRELRSRSTGALVAAGKRPSTPLPFLGGLSITGTNPVTLFSFTAVLAHAPALHPVFIPLGVLVGSLGWYGALGSAGHLLGNRARRATLWLRPLTAGAFVCFGAALLISAFFRP